MKKRFITIQERAEKIVKDGLKKEELFKFFDRLQRDVIEYIELFGQFGVNQDVVWSLYEEWQNLISIKKGLFKQEDGENYG